MKKKAWKFQRTPRTTPSRWTVRVRAADGAEEVIEANALISAVGQINRPKSPIFVGLETCRGPAFHSARWEGEYDLAGKRIAVVGTGASAIQFVRPLATDAEDLTIFQRSPQWALCNGYCQRRVSEGKKWLMKCGVKTHHFNFLRPLSNSYICSCCRF